MEIEECPTRVRLIRLSSGQLADDQVCEIEQHIVACWRCQGELHDYDARTDPLIDALREHAQSPVPGFSDELQQRLLLAETIGPRIWRERDAVGGNLSKTSTK